MAPSIVKKTRAQVSHVSIPSKGLSLEANTNAIDPQYAGVLTNFYVDDDRISVRAGYKKIATCPGGQPVDHLIPYYGQPERLLAATNHTLCDAQTGTLLRSGFTSNDWHWSSFSNLGDREYTIICNGADGVWGWDGGSTAGLAPVTITRIAGSGTGTPPPSNPAQCTVALADIGKFHDGMTVVISGADALHTKANGAHRITSVNNPPNTFSLVGVDLSGAGSDQTTGTMTATTQGSFEKLALMAPTGNTWLHPDDFQIVLAHQNRLWFADETNLAVYYLPIQQKDGVLAVLPMNAIFKKGGTIRAMYTWTVDAGMGMDDQLVVFTTNGEAAIYSGVDPASDFSLVGVYRFDPPMSKHSILNYGGELYVLIPTGVTPMISMIKSGNEGLDTVDRSIVPIFLQASTNHRDQFGWQMFLNPSSGRVFVNLPQGGGRYQQMVRHMPKSVYSLFSDIPARCWGWINPYVYFGDDHGNIYQMHPDYRSDDGASIRVDVQMAWSQFKSPALKHFKMILPYIVTDGDPHPQIDVKVDYDNSVAINEPELSSVVASGATWDLATWDVDYWVGGSRNWNNWTGVGGIGRVGAIRLSAQVNNCSFAVVGWDVLYETGSVFG
jgi:hypothetical protein